jgi:hypothetical protein
MASSSTLRQAASAVFAVTTVVPLLIFVWTLYVLDTLTRMEAQMGLGVALAVALLGYLIFRGLVSQMSDSITALGTALERPPAVAPAPAVASAPRAPNGQPAATPAVPGIGAIEEVQNLNRAMAVLWQSEAEKFKGRSVVISVVNSPRPIRGTIVMLSHDGLLIQTDRQDHVPVGYSRIAAIDAEKLSA